MDVFEEARRAANERMGEEISFHHAASFVFNEEATRDAIRHYALGIGDLNPLWTDGEYARRSRFGSIIAPPTFPYSVVLPSIGVLHIHFPESAPWRCVYGGTQWEFYRPIALGEGVHVTAKLVDAQIKQSKTVGRMLVLTSDVRYWNRQNEPLARAVCPQLRYVPSEGGNREIQPRTASADEIAATPPAEMLAERRTRRGPAVRFWEDVHEGDALEDLPKGLFRMTEILRWHSGTYGPPFSSTYVGMSTGHYDPLTEATRDRGVYDNGPIRGGWLGQLVTDWMGDWGDLLHLDYRLLSFGMVGEINTVRGNLTRKCQRESDAVVELRVWVETSSGRHTAEGTALVRLPTRADPQRAGA